MIGKPIKISKKCPNCDWRVFDKITPTTGVIEMKCPNCKRVIKIDLSLRKTNIKYRKAYVR
jgi:phage FluMu protein Com